MRQRKLAGYSPIPMAFDISEASKSNENVIASIAVLRLWPLDISWMIRL